MRVDYDKDQLAYALANALKERNEARIDAQKSKAYKRVLKETNLRQTERIRYLEGATNHACGTPLSVALRERDEAREEANKLSGAYEDATNYYARIIELKEELDEARKKYATEATEHMLAVNKLCNERDEARESTLRIDVLNFKLRKELDDAKSKIKSQADRIRYLEGATNHACGTPLSVALRERDEARENLDEEMKFHHRTHRELIETQCKLLDMDLKREEALDEIKRLKVILDLIKKDTI